MHKERVALGVHVVMTWQARLKEPGSVRVVATCVSERPHPVRAKVEDLLGRAGTSSRALIPAHTNTFVDCATTKLLLKAQRPFSVAVILEASSCRSALHLPQGFLHYKPGPSTPLSPPRGCY